jgi:hypothetical protein
MKESALLDRGMKPLVGIIHKLPLAKILAIATIVENNGVKRTRTAGFHNAIVTLYQLSYNPN